MTDPSDLTISEASQAIENGVFSPVQLVESCLNRINQVETRLKAWVQVLEEQAIESAEQATREIESRGKKGPLHGIPIGIKDIYYTKGIRTTACSKIRADFIPEYDSTAVAKLKKAGAIVLGKTVTTEFAAGDPPVTVNPWNEAHTPGGSSSGSAVAVSSGMCPGAMGSQTGGSILRPASYNGIVGLKPTFGRVSVYGVIPVAWSLDTIGPLVRSVRDAAIILQATAGYDDNDPGSARIPVPNYLAKIGQLDKPPKIGLVKDFFMDNSSLNVQSNTEETLHKLSLAGAEVDIVSLPKSFTKSMAIQWVIMNVESAAYHEEEFGVRADDYSEQLRKRIELGFLTPAITYIQAQRFRRVFRRDLDFLTRQWDVLITPSTPTAAPKDLSTTGDPMFQSPWTLAGLPAITIPSGIDHSSNMPLGIQLVASSFAENRLLAVAHWCEAVLDARLRPPI